MSSLSIPLRGKGLPGCKGELMIGCCGGTYVARMDGSTASNVNYLWQVVMVGFVQW